MRILWVENEMGYLATLRAAVEDEGYEVDRAETPRTALRKLKQGGCDYDLIIMDVLLGDEEIGNRPVHRMGWTGWTLFQVIRHDLHIPTPVLFLSVVNDEELVTDVEREDSTRYIIKPVYIPDFLTAIAQMNRSRSDKGRR